VAERVTDVLGPKLALHVPGQLIPAGALVTVPVPVPDSETVTVLGPVTATSSNRVLTGPLQQLSWLVSVSVYECPAMIAVVTCCHPELATQVGASGVLVVPEVLSVSVTVVQSWVTESAQVTSYQNDSAVSPAAAVKVWMMSESPLVSDAEPAMAA